MNWNFCVKFKPLVLAVAAFFIMLSTLVVAPQQAIAQILRPTQCVPIRENEVIRLFDNWNQSLRTGSPSIVTDLYAQNAVLLPTLANGPLATLDAIFNYFVGFLPKKPVARIDQQFIKIC